MAQQTTASVSGSLGGGRLGHRLPAALALSVSLCAPLAGPPALAAPTPASAVASVATAAPAAGTPAFVDIASNPFKADIAWLATQEVTTGWRIGTADYYKPFEAINRDQMAAFIYRFQGRMGYSYTTSAFADVPKTAPFAKEINYLASAGYAGGWTNSNGTLSYRPLTAMTRAAFATMIYKMDNPTFTPPTVSPFSDLKTTDPSYAAVTYLASIGVTKGWTMPDRTVQFRPNEAMRRDTMAAFIHRYFNRDVFEGRGPRSFRALWVTQDLQDLVTTQLNPQRASMGLVEYAFPDYGTIQARTHAEAMADAQRLSYTTDVVSSEWQGKNTAEQDSAEVSRGLLAAYRANPNANARLFSARGLWLAIGIARDTNKAWWTSLEVFATPPEPQAGVASAKRTATSVPFQDTKDRLTR